MVLKTFTALFSLAHMASVNAHTAITPALGVNGTPVRRDVRRPATRKPCGLGVSV